MTTPAEPTRPLNVVIAGTGVGGLEALIALRALAGKRVDITLLSPAHDFVFHPLSVGEPFALGSAERIPVPDIASEFDARLVREGLAAVDTGGHAVTTSQDNRLPYDRLIIAVGAKRVPAYEHVATFRGQEDAETFHGLVQDIEGGYSRSIAFVVPPGIAWSLPLYELALMTARRAFDMSADVEISFITAEERPLGVFGQQASAELQALLDEAGIALHSGVSAEVPERGTIVFGPERIHADRIVALPLIQAYEIAGLPADADGFIPIDDWCRVPGAQDVFAAGDGTAFPLKQGGIACQQADVAAEQIARDAGVPVDAEPFKPVLRGKLLTGGAARFMRHEVGGEGEPDISGTDNLWWPPTKVAGRYLAPFLQTQSAQGAHPIDLDSVRFAAR
jgi:sulfide:quinone oxidoreductase